MWRYRSDSHIYSECNDFSIDALLKLSQVVGVSKHLLEHGFHRGSLETGNLIMCVKGTL